jgi:DNA-binding GntR family transcriptional regulator
MGLRVDDSQAPYLQIADELRKAIQGGSLKPGDQLPSIRELSNRYGVASMTVQSALRVLRTEGLVYAIPGRGSFVRQQVNQRDATNEGEARTADYEIVRHQLDSMTDELRHLADRVAQLEELTPKKTSRGPRQSR